MIHTGDNKILLKDRTLFPERSVKLVLTSPPYGQLRTYESDVDVKALSDLLAPIVMHGGVVVWVVADVVKHGAKQMIPFKHALEFTQSGAFVLNDTIVWEKNAVSHPASRLNPCRYTQIYEYMHVFVRRGSERVTKPITFNMICDKPNVTAHQRRCSDRSVKNSNVLVKRKTLCPVPPSFSPRNNIWRYSVGGRNKRSFHPAIFPYPLAVDVIASWSNEGDTVLDIFSGSGTTVLAAFNSGRRGVGIEIDERYAEASRVLIDETIKNGESP